MQTSLRATFKSWLPFLLAAWTTGIALKFITYQIIVNEGLYNGQILTQAFFPYFPNALDSAFIIVSVIYLAWKSRK